MSYIRGPRQFKAIWIGIGCLLKRNWNCTKREIEIFLGLAKPYQAYFAPMFKEQYIGLFGESAYDDLKKRTGAKETSLIH